MRVNRPTFSLKDIYNGCISNYRDESKKERMLKIYPNLLDDEERYSEELNNLTLFCETKHITHATDVSETDLKKLYTEKLLNKELMVRKYYNELLAGSDWCPYCVKRMTSTLDHFLSKSNYPNFSITPLNLVPCCSDCNSKKDNQDDDLTLNTMLFHPYQESLNNFKWLEASIVVNDGKVFFNFYVVNDNVDETTFNRLVNYLKVLELGDFYSKLANVEFSRYKTQYSRIYLLGGEDELLEHFISQREFSKELEHGENSFEYVYNDVCIKYIKMISSIL